MPKRKSHGRRPTSGALASTKEDERKEHEPESVAPAAVAPDEASDERLSGFGKEVILVMGKSGSGKQSRIDALIEMFKLKQISTGALFRESIEAFHKVHYEGDILKDGFFDPEKGTFLPDLEIQSKIGSADPLAVLGLKAKCFIDRGVFCPDSITNEMFVEAFRRAGRREVILDGYPRTEQQAKFLLDHLRESNGSIEFILLVDSEDEMIVRRTVGRRLCPSCKKVFHVEYNPPKDGRRCTVCDVDVIIRSDDTEEKIGSRLREFAEKTVPAIALLQREGIPLVTVPGNLPVLSSEAVMKSVKDALIDSLPPPSKKPRTK